MAIQIVRNQIIDAIINEVKVDDGAIAFAKLKSADITTDLSSSATTVQIARADAIKTYVDNEIAQIGSNSYKDAARVATTAELTASYSNGSSGVGATITADSNGAISIDGVSLSANDRVVVKDGVSGLVGTENAGNGIYVVTTVGDGSNPYVLTRATDSDTASEINGAIISITMGSTNKFREYRLYSGGSGTDPLIGTDPISFQLVSAGGQINAGKGLVKDSTNSSGVDKFHVELSSASGLTFSSISDSATLELDVEANKGVQITAGGELSFIIDGSTLSQGSSGAKVADAGITETQLNTSVAGDGITGGAGTALSVDRASNSGLSFLSNQLRVDLSELADGTVAVSADFLAFQDADGGSKLVGITDLAIAQAGTGISASSGQFSLDLVGLNDASIDVANDSMIFADSSDTGTPKVVGITDIAIAQAGNGISASSGQFALDLNELTDTAVDITADSFAFIDSDNSSKKDSLADLISAMAGTGIAQNALSKDLEIDLNGLADDTIDITGDSFAFVDSGGSSKKELVRDLISAMAGDGLQQETDGGSPSYKLNVVKTNMDTLTTNGTATTFNLSAEIPQGFEVVIAFRNGLALEQVPSSPSGVDQFSISRNGGDASVALLTFGAAPASDDSVQVFFMAHT